MSTIPAAYRALADDAAGFPPGDTPLGGALAEHRAHLGREYADLVGPLVVADEALPELIDAVGLDPTPAPLPVAVVVTGGAGAIEPAVRWAARADELALVSLGLGLRDESDLPRNARRTTTVVDQLLAAGDLDEDTAVYVEPPLPPGPEPAASWLDALDEIATLDLGLTFRAGGPDPALTPDSFALAASIDAALDRELRFTCTDLPHAIRDQQSHGFLNVLAATRRALDGAPRDEVAAVLEDTHGARVAEVLADAGPDGLTSARRWFRSFRARSVARAAEELERFWDTAGEGKS